MLIEILVQLNGTLRQDIDRVAGAINVARRAMRFSAEHIAVFGPVWERDDMGRAVGVRYRVGDTYPAGYDAIWSRPVTRQMEFNADARGSAKAA